MVDFSKLKRWKRRSWEDQEQPKAHEELPESLGLGVREQLMESGLYIWLEPRENPGGFAFHPYIVLGKYAEPQWDGSIFYVADWTLKGVNAPTSKHDHLLTAVAAIIEIITTYDERDENADLQD